MFKGPLVPSQFVATQFSSAAEKAAFGNTFLHFVKAECPRTLFTEEFYSRLSMTFGHIAHCDLEGFYSAWFANATDRLRFIERTFRFSCHGSPEHTFSDVEQAIREHLRCCTLLSRYRLCAAEAERSFEMDQLQRLEAKYRNGAPQNLAEMREPVVQATVEERNAPPSLPLQRTLF